MKITSTILLLLFFFTLNATEINYKLSKNQKIEGTFSGDLDQKQTIHLIFTKNKESGMYEIIPFFLNEQEETILLDLVTFSKRPYVISYHLNNNTLTLLIKQNLKKSKQLDIIDFDLITKKNIKKSISNYKNPITIFRLKKESVLITKAETTLTINRITNTLESKKTNIEINKNNLQDFKSIFSLNPEIINTNEYIKNGSINQSKAYNFDSFLYFENMNLKNYELKTLLIDLKDIHALKFNTFKNGEFESIKNINTFLYDKKIFTILVSKNESFIKVTDIITANKVYNASLTKDFSKYINLVDIRNYIKKSSKKWNKPTITVNKSIENNLVINIDFVNIETYSYNHYWWFHNMMMQQQQQMNNQFIQQRLNSLPKFGPNPIIYDNLPIPKKEKKEIKLVMNTAFEILENATTETVKKKIDKDKYLEPLKKNINLRNITASFLNNSIRYIFYSRSLNTVFIKSSNL